MSVNVVDVYLKKNKKIVIEYLKLFFDSHYINSIANDFVDTYFEARYYNYGNDINIKQSINKYLDDYRNTIKDSKNQNIVDLTNMVLKDMFYLDSANNIELIKERINKINNYRISKLNINNKTFCNDLFNMVENNFQEQGDFFNNFLSSDFTLDIKKMNIKNLYDVKLKHFINFNALYSAYAIENAFNTGKVNEDKMYVTYYLYAVLVLKNIILGDFKKNYLLDFDISLFDKQKKISGLLNIINNEAVLGLTSFKIKYSDFINQKDNIYDLTKEGYSFSIIIDDEYENTDINFTKLQLFKYVIIDKEKYQYENILSMLNVVIL